MRIQTAFRIESEIKEALKKDAFEKKTTANRIVEILIAKYLKGEVKINFKEQNGTNC
jgi:hypothetical protein